MGYGTPSEGMRASQPKMMLNTIIVMNGCSTAHPAPKIVCLYRTFMSRQIRKEKISRCSQTSFSSRGIQLWGGLISTVAIAPPCWHAGSRAGCPLSFTSSLTAAFPAIAGEETGDQTDGARCDFQAPVSVRLHEFAERLLRYGNKTSPSRRALRAQTTSQSLCRSRNIRDGLALPEQDKTLRTWGLRSLEGDTAAFRNGQRSSCYASLCRRSPDSPG